MTRPSNRRRNLLAPLFAAAFAGAVLAPAQDAFSSVVKPVIASTCVSCHGGPDPEGGFDVSRVVSEGADALDAAAWRAVRERVLAGDMPPEGAKIPLSKARRAALVGFAEERGRTDASTPIDPGRVGVRRLARHEYAATIRDIFGVSVRPEEDLPPDDLAFGFDNVAEALRLPPTSFERYARLAERVVEEAIVDEDPKTPSVAVYEAEKMECELKPSTQDGFRVLYSNASVTARFRAPRDGVYRLRARIAGDQAGPELPKFAFVVDGRRGEAIETDATRKAPKIYEAEFRLVKGARSIGVAFLNDFFDPDNPDRRKRDRNLAIDRVEVVGPVDVLEPPAFHRALFAGDDPKRPTKDRAARLLAPQLLRIYRRPPEASHVDRLAALAAETVKAGGSFEGGMRAATAAALTSPRFLFRVERDPPGAPPVRALDGYELATRLSYFLTASAPDDRLLALAAEHATFDAETTRAEAERLLDDARASSLAENFAPQWLELRNLVDVAPDPQRYPAFDDALRHALRREVELLFDAVLRERRDVRDLVDPGFTFVNERLAKHYGMAGVFGPEFRRVSTADRRRGGVLLSAGVLAVTSNPTRTSPVKRGKWVLENLLDAPPPPPPPGVGAFKEGSDPLKAATLRELMARHRADPACASCHARMDALGLSLEAYDAIGSRRDRDGDAPIDTTGTLPNGAKVRGAEDLRALVRDDPAFVRGLAKKLFVYALGRGVSADDERAIEKMVATLPKSGPTLRDLVLGVVALDAFRLRRTSDR